MTWHNLGSFEAVGGIEPRHVSIQGNEVRIPAPEHVVEGVYNHARSWIEQTNREYSENVRRTLRENEAEQRRELKADIRRAEASQAARARILERLARQQSRFVAAQAGKLVRATLIW